MRSRNYANAVCSVSGWKINLLFPLPCLAPLDSFNEKPRLLTKRVYCSNCVSENLSFLGNHVGQTGKNLHENCRLVEL